MSEQPLKTYLAIYKGRKLYISATNSVEAQYLAIEKLNPSKKYMVTVIPADKERKKS